MESSIGRNSLQAQLARPQTGAASSLHPSGCNEKGRKTLGAMTIFSERRFFVSPESEWSRGRYFQVGVGVGVAKILSTPQPGLPQNETSRIFIQRVVDKSEIRRIPNDVLKEVVNSFSARLTSAI